LLTKVSYFWKTKTRHYLSKKGENISLFGCCQIDTYRSGTGFGAAVNVPYAVNALQGLRANPAIEINEALVTIGEQWIV
jgi:beta-glucosidase